MTTPRHPQSRSGFTLTRSGFTLTELLIAITVLAILAGFIAPAVIAALTSVKERAVSFEMKQMELALEQFKNDHGFYPPTFGTAASGAEINSAAAMLAYLNKIAPQHAEASTSFPGSGVSRLVDWWANVGSNLDETTSLQFWLSGLCKNKQYPLTGGVSVDTSGGTTGVMTITAFGADFYSDGTAFPAALVVERNNYFEFKSNQVRPVAAGFGAHYVQSFGDEDEDLRFRYLDYKSYRFGDTTARAYYDDLNADTTITNNEFFNPKSFQLITFGRDGLPGTPGDILTVGAAGADNIANFTEGRLDTYAR